MSQNRAQNDAMMKAMRNAHKQLNGAVLSVASPVGPDGEVQTLIQSNDGKETITIATMAREITIEECEWLMALCEHGVHLLALTEHMGGAYRAMRDRALLAENSLAKLADAKTGKPKDFAAECAMKCNAEAFQRFLGVAENTEDAPKQAADLVRQRLGIASRIELNKDQKLAADWRALVKDFEHWEKQQAAHFGQKDVA